MSKIVELSTGEKVHLREKLTHKAMKAHSDTMNKGRVIKEYVEDGDEKTVVETPAVNGDAAIEAALIVMIEKVVSGTDEKTATQEWFEGLSQDDYLLLVTAFNSLIREMTERLRAGKKNH